MGVVGEPADLIDHRGGFAELGFRQVNIADEGVEMLDERDHDLPQSGAFRAVHDGKSVDGDIVLVGKDHWGLRFWVMSFPGCCHVNKPKPPVVP